MIRTAKGEMAHSTDAKRVSDIDARGGLGNRLIKPHPNSE